jgi:hypothetical protein
LYLRPAGRYPSLLESLEQAFQPQQVDPLSI